MNLQSTLRTPSSPPQVGLILAGGRSARMGTDKAALRIGAQSLLELMQAKLHAVGLTEVWISGPQPGAIADLHPGLGPLGGIASAVACAEDGTQMLVVAVDQPRLSGALLRTLLDAPDAPAVRYEREPLPMRLTVGQRLKAVLDQQLNAVNTKDRSLFAWQQALAVCSLGVSNVQSFELVSVNTPEQWQTFYAEVNSLAG